MIRFACHQCGAPMQVDDKQAGRTGTCPHCHASVTVPPAYAGVVPPPPIPAPPESGAAGPGQTSGKAVASLVLGLLSVFGGCTFFTGVPGIIFGHMALSEIGRRRGELGGNGIAVAGLVFSYIGTVFLLFYFSIGAAIMLPALARAREAARRASCQNNEKQMGLVFMMFANESEGNRFPMLSSESGRLMVEPDEIYDAFLTDPSILICPSNPLMGEIQTAGDPRAIIDDHSYFYLGYIVTNDTEVEAFAAAYRQRIAEGLPFDGNLSTEPGTGSEGGDALVLLGEGFERILTDDARQAAEWQSEIPVLIEPPHHHAPPGGNVLYMDGHVEFLRYPGEWPMTEATIGILEELAGPQGGG